MNRLRLNQRSVLQALTTGARLLHRRGSRQMYRVITRDSAWSPHAATVVALKERGYLEEKPLPDEPGHELFLTDQARDYLAAGRP